MLRDWGYDGVIITDALDMAAIRETVGLGGGSSPGTRRRSRPPLHQGNPTNPGDAALPDQDEQDFRAARDGIVAALRDGSLSRSRVEEAAGRVAALATKLRAAAAAADEEEPTDDFDAAEIVRRVVTISGGALETASGLAVIDARRRSTLAVDSFGSYVASALAEEGLRAPRRGIRTGVRTGSCARRGHRGGRDHRAPDRSARHGCRAAALVERAAVRDPRAVVVNVGLPTVSPLPLPTVEVAAASRLGAQTAREALLGCFTVQQRMTSAG